MPNRFGRSLVRPGNTLQPANVAQDRPQLEPKVPPRVKPNIGPDSNATLGAVPLPYQTVAGSMQAMQKDLIYPKLST